MENFCKHNAGSCIRVDTVDENREYLNHVYIGRNRSLDNTLTGVDINRVSGVIISQNIIKRGLLANDIVLRQEKKRVWIIFNEIYDSVFGIRPLETMEGAQGADVFIIGNLIYDIAPKSKTTTSPKNVWKQGVAISLWFGNLDRYIIDNTIDKANNRIVAFYHYKEDINKVFDSAAILLSEIHLHGNFFSQKDDAEHNYVLSTPQWVLLKLKQTNEPVP